jgi:hypothetical protein
MATVAAEQTPWLLETVILPLLRMFPRIPALRIE